MKWTSKHAACLFMCALGAVGCGGEITDEFEGMQEQDILSSNGLKYNGLKYNGLKYNGASFSAIQYSGLRYNGMKLSGAAYPTYTGSTMSNTKITKTTLSATLPNGVTVSGKGLVGATMVGVLSSGVTVTVGISEVVTTVNPDILHYRLKTWDTSTLAWYDTCPSSGMSLPIAALWKSDGSRVTSTTSFTLACVDSGALGKCAMLGYYPWSLASHHQTCVRMIRGDYCGTGVGYTRDGTKINLYDNLGIQKDDRSKYSYNWIFDAEWGPSGAVCISYAGRPADQKIGCSRPSSCSSSTTYFRSGVLLKDWMVAPSTYSYTTYESQYNQTNVNINITNSTNIAFDSNFQFNIVY